MLDWIRNIVNKFYEIIIVVLCVIIVFLLSWVIIDTVCIRILKNETTRITSLYNSQKSLNEANQSTIDADKATIEKMQESCASRIKTAVNAVEKADPVCPDGKKPIYKATKVLK